jgi:hypothetical protein
MHDWGMTMKTGGPRHVMAGVRVLLVAVVTMAMSGCSHDSSSEPTTQAPSSHATSQPTGGHKKNHKHHAKPAKASKSPLAPAKVKQVSRDGTPAHPTVSAPPAPFSSSVKYPDGLTFTVTGIHQGRVNGHGRGVIKGPKTTFDLRFVNGGSKPVDLTQVVPTAEFGHPARIARPVDDEHTRDFGVVVAPGHRATATYAFSIPTDQLSDVTVYLDFDGRHFAATFHGSARH